MYCVRWYTSSPLPLLRPSTYIVHIRHPHHREKKNGFLKFWNSRLHDAFTFALHIYYGRCECARSHFRVYANETNTRKQRMFFFYFGQSSLRHVRAIDVCKLNETNTVFDFIERWPFSRMRFHAVITTGNTWWRQSQFTIFIVHWQTKNSIIDSNEHFNE